MWEIGEGDTRFPNTMNLVSREDPWFQGTIVSKVSVSLNASSLGFLSVR